VPSPPADVDRGAQVDVLGGQRRAMVFHQFQEVWAARLQRALQLPVAGQVDVVRIFSE